MRKRKRFILLSMLFALLMLSFRVYAAEVDTPVESAIKDFNQYVSNEKAREDMAH